MDKVLKVALTAIFVIFITSTGSSIVATQQSVHNANNYFDGITTIIAASNYSRMVIDDCIEEAESNGYTLRVDIVTSSHSSLMRYAVVEMDYIYKINMLGINDVKTLHKIT